MKRITAILTILMLMLIPSAFSSEEQEVDAGLTPDSPLYFLDRWGEGLSLAFTINEAKKVSKNLEYAQERLAEIELAKDEKDREKLEQRFEKHIENAYKHSQSKESTENIDAIKNQFKKRNKVQSQNTIKHQYTNQENKFLEEFENETAQIIVKDNINNNTEYYYVKVSEKGIELTSEISEPDYTIEVKDKEEIYKLIERYNNGENIEYSEVSEIADIPISLKARALKVGVLG